MKKEFHYFCINKLEIILLLNHVEHPILWNNNGQYGLIPFARIQNALENWKNVHDKDIVPSEQFDWCDVIKISPQIANALLGEDKDDKCTYRGKDSSDTSPASS